jgi:hypothetical protein
MKNYLKFFTKVSLVIIFGLALNISASFAQSNGEIQAKVQTRMPYAFDNKANGSQKQKVFRELVLQFKKDGFKKAMTNMPQAKVALLNQYFDEMTTWENIDQFVTRIETVETCDTRTDKGECGKIKDNTIKLSGVVVLSMSAIDVYLQQNSAAASAPETSEFAVMFIARTVDSQKKFEDKVTKVQEEKSVDSTEVTNGEDGISETTGLANQSMSVVASGGSVERKADKYTYKIDKQLSARVGQAIVQALINAGYEPFPTDDYVEDYEIPYLDEMIDEGLFTEDGTLGKRELNGIKKATIEEEIPYFGVGTIDFGLPSKDVNSGYMQVPANVSFEVFKSNGKRMRAVATVAPTIVYGDDPNQDATVALLNAMNNAVALAMDTVVSQMQLKELN